MFRSGAYDDDDGTCVGGGATKSTLVHTLYCAVGTSWPCGAEAHTVAVSAVLLEVRVAAALPLVVVLVV